jgi:hypothetical protein
MYKHHVIKYAGDTEKTVHVYQTLEMAISSYISTPDDLHLRKLTQYLFYQRLYTPEMIPGNAAYILGGSNMTGTICV